VCFKKVWSLKDSGEILCIFLVEATWTNWECLGGLLLSAGGVARDLKGVKKKFAWLESLSSARGTFSAIS